MKTTIKDFTFKMRGYGHYHVTYTSPVTGKTWNCVTDNMDLIDRTKNADNPTQVELNALKRRCKL